MPFMQIFGRTLVLFVSSSMLVAQDAPKAARGYVDARKSELVRQFTEFLSIPNVADC
jgi:hypothetical protein